MAGINFEAKALILKDVPKDKRFVCSNGDSYSSLKDLVEGLKRMKDEVFFYHVTEDKNDFSTWIYDVVGDVRLANNLRSVNDKKRMIKKIKGRIAYLKKSEVV